MENKKVIIVTGASSGMGKASVQRLAKDGHIVYGSVRKEEEKKIIEEMGGKPLLLEMTDHQTLEAGVQQVLAEQNRIDVLFNNAGYAVYGAVEDVSIADARKQFEVNLFGLARMTQLVLPQMRKQKSGLILNTSSMGGKIYTPLGAWYHATKHALEGWSDCLRLELKQFGIHVVILEPGMVETNFATTLYQPMVDRSKNGPYEKMVQSLVDANSDENGNPQYNGTKPEVIADLVAKIVASKNPKTRYAKGKLAKPLLFIRKYFGDRIFDKIIMSRFN